MTPLSIEISDDLVEALTERVREQLEVETVWRDLKGTARAFETSERQIRYWREQGAPAKRVGRKLWFSLKQLEQWLEGR